MVVTGYDVTSNFPSDFSGLFEQLANQLTCTAVVELFRNQMENTFRYTIITCCVTNGPMILLPDIRVFELSERLIQTKR